MNEFWIQIIVVIGGIASGIVGGWYGIMKISMKQTERREERMVKMFEESQQNIIHLYTQKNGQLERLSVEFSRTIKESNKQAEITRDKLTQAINQHSQMISDLRRTMETTNSLNREAIQVANEIKQ